MTVPTKTPTGQELKDFRAFVKVQKSGKHNMLSPGAQRAVGIDRDRMLFVIENYDWLASYAGNGG